MDPRMMFCGRVPFSLFVDLGCSGMKNFLLLSSDLIYLFHFLFLLR